MDANEAILSAGNSGSKDPDYPATRYSKDGKARVASKEEDKALGSGWYDSPSKVPGAKPKPKPAKVVKAKLAKKAKAPKAATAKTRAKKAAKTADTDAFV